MTKLLTDRRAACTLRRLEMAFQPALAISWVNTLHEFCPYLNRGK